MKKLFLLPLLSLLLASQVFAQTAALDSLRQSLRALPEKPAKAKALAELAQTLSGYDLQEALRYGQAGIALAEKLGLAELLTELQVTVGRACANSGRPDSALHYFGLAKAAYQERSDQRGLASVLSKIKWVHDFLGQHERAVELALETIDIYTRLGDELRQAAAYSDLARSFEYLKKHDEALDYAIKAYRTQERLEQWGDLGVTAQLLGDIYLQKTDYDLALRYADASIAAFRREGLELDAAFALNSRGNILKYLQRYEAALADYRESMGIAAKAGYANLETSAMSNMAHIYNLLGDYPRALPLHLRLVETVRRSGEMQKAAESYLLLAEAYAGIGKHDSAYHYQKIHTTLNDSLYSEASNARAAELEAQYRTAQKEATIALQESQIARQQSMQRFSFGLLGLLLLIAGLLYYGYRAKQHNNRALQQKNEEIALLLKEIHHRVKNNLQIIASLLNLQSVHIQDEAALDAVREGKARVESMSLIHQRLYSADNVSKVDMRNYLYELGDTVLNTFGVEPGRIALIYQIEPIELDVDTAIPLGLIINELLTNSLKYAFPDGRKGTLEIWLQRQGTGLRLEVRDDGVGQAATAERTGPPAFGTSLVRMLSKKLKGVPQSEAPVGQGTATIIYFEHLNEFARA